MGTFLIKNTLFYGLVPELKRINDFMFMLLLQFGKCMQYLWIGISFNGRYRKVCIEYIYTDTHLHVHATILIQCMDVVLF